jgi:hypothetical protein
MTETHPQNRRLGYTRVSTYGQTLAPSLSSSAARAAPRINSEKLTGARADRRQLLDML